MKIQATYICRKCVQCECELAGSVFIRGNKVRTYCWTNGIGLGNWGATAGTDIRQHRGVTIKIQWRAISIE